MTFDNTETSAVQLLGMIALRALSEHDPVEFRRLTDVPRAALESLIRDALADQPNEQAEKLNRRIDDALKLGMTSGETHAVLDEIYFTGVKSAQAEAIRNTEIKEISSPASPIPMPQTAGAPGEPRRPSQFRLNEFEVYKVLRDEVKRSNLNVPVFHFTRLRNALFALQSAIDFSQSERAVVVLAEVLSKLVEPQDRRKLKTADAKQLAWSFSEQILALVGRQFSEGTNDDDLFTSLTTGRAEEWLLAHTVKASVGRPR
jgi:hypothetical protein